MLVTVLMMMMWKKEKEKVRIELVSNRTIFSSIEENPEQPTHSSSQHSFHDDSDEYIESKSYIARTLQHRDTIRTAVLPSGPEDIPFGLIPVDEKTETEEDGMPPVDTMEVDDNVILSDSEEIEGGKEGDPREVGGEEGEKQKGKETPNHMEMKHQLESSSLLNALEVSTPNEQSTVLAAYPPSRSTTTNQDDYHQSDHGHQSSSLVGNAPMHPNSVTHTTPRSNPHSAHSEVLPSPITRMAESLAVTRDSYECNSMLSSSPNVSSHPIGDKTFLHVETGHLGSIGNGEDALGELEKAIAQSIETLRRQSYHFERELREKMGKNYMEYSRLSDSTMEQIQQVIQQASPTFQFEGTSHEISEKGETTQQKRTFESIGKGNDLEREEEGTEKRVKCEEKKEEKGNVEGME